MYDSGDLMREPTTDSKGTGAPHRWQNLEWDGSSVAQDAQVSASLRPHAMQKSDLGGVSPRTMGALHANASHGNAMTTDPGRRQSI